MPSQRDQDMKNKEDFASGYDGPNLNMPSLVGVDKFHAAAKKKEEEAEAPRPKNFDIAFLTDKQLQSEQDYLPITPQSDLVFILGPRVGDSNRQSVLKDIKLPEETRRKMLEEELKKLPSGFRVLAMSNKIENVTYKVGDYVFFQAPHRMMLNFFPKDETLAYYEVRNLDVRYSMTQEDALRFKPKNKKKVAEAVVVNEGEIKE